jgi:hypothetical protein
MSHQKRVNAIFCELPRSAALEERLLEFASRMIDLSENHISVIVAAAFLRLAEHSGAQPMLCGLSRRDSRQ